MKRAAAVAVLVGSLGLVGCASSGGASPTSASMPRVTYPQGSSRWPIVVPFRRKALARANLSSLPRFLSPTRLVIYTWGSGSCSAVPDRLVVFSPHSISIHLMLGSGRGRLPVARKPGPHYGCTADLTTTTMAIAIDPRQIDVHRRLTIRFYYYESTKPVIRAAPAL